jgi:hypothetical protein
MAQQHPYNTTGNPYGSYTPRDPSAAAQAAGQAVAAAAPPAAAAAFTFVPPTDDPDPSWLL